MIIVMIIVLVVAIIILTLIAKVSIAIIVEINSLAIKVNLIQVDKSKIIYTKMIPKIT